MLQVRQFHVFDGQDLNRTGQLEPRELARYLATALPGSSMAERRQLMVVLDLNANEGGCTWEDVCQAVRAIELKVVQAQNGGTSQHADAPAAVAAVKLTPQTHATAVANASTISNTPKPGSSNDNMMGYKSQQPTAVARSVTPSSTVSSTSNSGKPISTTTAPHEGSEAVWTLQYFISAGPNSSRFLLDPITSVLYTDVGTDQWPQPLGWLDESGRVCSKQLQSATGDTSC